jgi:dolichyl-phosphate beta-glucosyltransferase
MTLTLVVPCFNEADRLDVDAFQSFDQADFLFVDDGSTDGTGAVLAALCAQNPDRFRVLTLDRNSGKGEAVRQGVLQASKGTPDFVGFIDADLSTGLDEVPAMIALLERQPSLLGVLGSRVWLLGRRIDRKRGRHYSGRIFATLVSWTFRIPVYDTQCGAKCFRATPKALSLFNEPFLSRWIFDVELLARFMGLADDEGLELGQVLVEHPLMAWKDVAGSKLRVRHGFRALIDLFRIRRKYR